MSQKRLPLTEQLRQAIDTCGESRYAVAKATGMDQSALSRFMSGERGVSMQNLDALGEYLGLELTTRRPAKRPAKKGR